MSLLNVPAMAISSTDCRARVEEDEPVWYLVPDGVVQYINKYGLYVHDEHTSTTLLAVDRDTENGPRETTRSTL